MAEQPMIQALGDYPAYELSRLQSCLSSSFRTVVEIIAYYDRMDGYDEMERLEFVRDWLAEALAQLYGAAQVNDWDAEAKSPEFSPFA
jgi:hypothetical protein